MGTTSLQGTKAVYPKCPYLGGSTVYICFFLHSKLCTDYVPNPIQAKDRELAVTQQQLRQKVICEVCMMVML